MHRLRAASIAFLVALATVSAAEPLWFKLPEQTETLTVEGVAVSLPIRPEASITPATPEPLLAVRARASLKDLQDKAATIFATLAARKSNCENRWSFPRLDRPEASGGKLRIAGSVRFEKWVCTAIGKTRLFRETADFVLALFPVHAPADVRIKAELESFDVGNGLLGDIGLGDELGDALRDQLDKALGDPNNRFGFPPEILALEPQFTGAAIEAGENGAELAVAASAGLSAGDLQKILQLLQ